MRPIPQYGTAPLLLQRFDETSEALNASLYFTSRNAQSSQPEILRIAMEFPSSLVNTLQCPESALD
jgi:hypothetical protein